MAVTARRIGPIGDKILKVVTITAATGTRQAIVLGSKISDVLGFSNSVDSKGAVVEPNIDADGNASNGSLAVSNEDSGPDTIQVSVLVNE